MERFDDMLTDIKCNDNSIEMVFKDDATFAYTQEVWDWVNGDQNSSFVMVAGAGDCGNNTRRLPYVVTTLQYDEVTKKTSIDFNHKLPFSVAISSKGLEARLACLSCNSSGSFDMEFRISQKFFVPTGASMKIKPNNVAATTQVKLSGSIDVKDALTKEFNILEIPISGLKIPGILDLGPFLTVSVGAEFTAITLTAGVTSGATFAHQRGWQRGCGATRCLHLWWSRCLFEAFLESSGRGLRYCPFS